MTRQRTIPFVGILAIMAGCGDSGPGVDKAPTKLWEVTGLKNPESALLSLDKSVLFVSNVAGQPTDKDGNGFISKVTPDGKIETLEWVKGLDAPKGLAQSDGRLYVSDNDKLVEIDIAGGTIVQRYDAAGAQFLNDVAADGQGHIYVSDMATNTIWRLADGKFEKWLESPALLHPNGLHVAGDALIVASWGSMSEAEQPQAIGRLLQVSLTDKTVGPLGDGSFTGHLDGLEPDGAGGYFVTDWMAGKFYRVDASGKATELLSLEQGAADIGIDPATKTVFIPQMMKDALYAYKIE